MLNDFSVEDEVLFDFPVTNKVKNRSRFDWARLAMALLQTVLAAFMTLLVVAMLTMLALLVGLYVTAVMTVPLVAVPAGIAFVCTIVYFYVTDKEIFK